MSTTGIRSENSTASTQVGQVDLKLEVITIPVSDLDRSKSFMAGSAGGSMPTSATG